MIGSKILNLETDLEQLRNNQKPRSPSSKEHFLRKIQFEEKPTKVLEDMVLDFQNMYIKIDPAKTASKPGPCVTPKQISAQSSVQGNTNKTIKECEGRDQDSSFRDIPRKVVSSFCVSPKLRQRLGTITEENHSRSNQKMFQTSAHSFKEKRDIRASKAILEDKLKSLLDEAARLKQELDQSNKELEKQHEMIDLKDTRIEELQTKLEEIKREKETIAQEKQQMQIEYAQQCEYFQDMNKVIQTLKGNMRVFCRLKPCPSEQQGQSASNLTITEQFITLQSSKRTCKYQFDQVFSMSSDQEAVFKEVKPFVVSAMTGVSVSIFAYGPTGSGKTFTVLGDVDNQATQVDHLLSIRNTSGIIPRTFDFVFNNIREHELVRKCKIFVNLSCLEIYNEELFDLCDPSNSKNLRIVQLNKRHIVQGLSQKRIENLDSAMRIVSESESNRTVGKTRKNDRSSRSHSVYRISFINGETKKKFGELNITDLAGSEKNNLPPSKSTVGEETKKLQKEANFINKSLTTLGRIIRMKKAHAREEGTLILPVRESKLTQVLQDALDGKGETLMIANIYGDVTNIQETKEVLDFCSIPI